MKKTFRLLAAAGLLICLCCLSMSGCSDFDFNPIGNWTLSSNKTYIDDNLFKDDRPGYMLMQTQDSAEPEYVYIGDLVYCFYKSGTGIMMMDTPSQQIQTQEFTYEYTDKQVVLHITDEVSKKNNADPVTMIYDIEKDKDGNIILKNQNRSKVNDTEGKEHDMNVVRILTKR